MLRSAAATARPDHGVMGNMGGVLIVVPVLSAPADDMDRASSGGEVALTDSETICHARCGVPNVHLLLPEFFGPSPHFSPFNCFQHNSAQRIVSKRSENDTLPDASAAARSNADKNLQGLGIDCSLDHAINQRGH